MVCFCLLCVCVCVRLCFMFDVNYLVMMYGILCFVCVCVCVVMLVWFACDLLCDVVWYVYLRVRNVFCVFVAAVIVCFLGMC